MKLSDFLARSIMHKVLTNWLGCYQRKQMISEIYNIWPCYCLYLMVSESQLRLNYELI